MPQGAHLLGEHGFISIVVGDRRNHRGVGTQCDCRQFVALHLEASDQFGCQVLRVGRRAAVATGKDLAVVQQTPDHRLNSFGNGRGQQLDGVEFGLCALLEVLTDTVGQVHGW